MMEARPSFSTPATVINNPWRRNFSDIVMAGDGNTRPVKKAKVENLIAAVQSRFSSPLSGTAPLRINEAQNKKTINPPARRAGVAAQPARIHKQFWKAGDYDGAPSPGDGNWESYAGGSDHIRVHPRFLHSNATSHRWVLGAFAELLDNSLDEVRNGATFVNVDMIENKKNGDRMLIIEDNGGGMDPIKMRQCMSLGYSSKSKIANTIGQYGNGFKTSTMRLGADVVVFSRSRGKNGSKSTQSIGLLSYTFLRSTQKEDIEVPMIDYERRGQVWEKIARATDGDLNDKVDTIVQWSPFESEADILEQFDAMEDHGTRIFIYNLWEDDQSLLELDFDTDPHDIQIRGANRDEKNIQMAQQYPNSRHFLTYKHSLRSYASILYLRVPDGFRMMLRGKDIEHHNIVNDMMMSQKKSYRPQQCPDNMTIKESFNMVANISIGFVKDARAHIDVQGFNVYHKNRLIKPFWRVWHPPGSDGRGVIGVLEANFVEPAHDKQGFERTIVLLRLEAKLAQMQKDYWSTNCHLIGYARRRNKKALAQGTSGPELDAAVPVPRKTVSFRSKSVDKIPTANPVSSNSAVPGPRKNVTMPSQSADRNTDGKITWTLNGAVPVAKPSKSMDKGPNGNISATLNGAVPVAKPSKSMDKGRNGNITATLNGAVPVPPSKSMDKGPNGNITATLNGAVPMPRKNIYMPSKLLEKSGNVNNEREGVASSRRVQNNVNSNKTSHKQKRMQKLRRSIQRAMPPQVSMQRDDYGRLSQKEFHPPEKSKTLSRSIVEENSGRKIVEHKKNAGLESRETSQGYPISTEKMTDPVLVESFKMRSLFKDLEQERKKCSCLTAELDQERSKRKPLEQELDLERNKCKSLVLELNQEREKCKALIKERDYLIDVFSDALNSRIRQRGK